MEHLAMSLGGGVIPRRTDEEAQINRRVAAHYGEQPNDYVQESSS